jgi:serine O-acetyltransferase
MFSTILEDIRAVRRNDPSAHSWPEVVLCHAPLHAILLHRLAHWVFARGRLRLLGKLVATFNRALTGVEIHPAARIGKGLFIDHGAGVVIGETVVMGEHCFLFHNVTLGGTGRYQGQRHPIVGDHVFIGTGATVLGPVRVGDYAKIGANASVINHDVPAHSTVVGTPARVVKLRGERVDEPLPRTIPPAGAVLVELEV